MEELRKLLREMLNENLQHIILSNARKPEAGIKVRIRPVIIKEKLYFQESRYVGTQVFHANYEAPEMAEKIENDMRELFKQAEFAGDFQEAVVLVSKKGKVTVKRKKIQKESAKQPPVRDLSHNRTKQYILQEGQPVDFLVGLGVQTPDGKIAKARYDKFRQINRYLEFIEDILEELPKDRCIRIIDFGCGKSYLTFAMYYYLHEMQKRDIEVTGLDLKTDVIRHCSELAEKLHYDRLHFERGDISTYAGNGKVDMVVSLHACDTATDYALEKAVKWGAEVILAVPCCQHEVNKQLQCAPLYPILRYGLIKERMAALITDALRADILEQQGYSTQILEFIDMEHTPKNLLIRAVKNKKMQPKGKREVKASDISDVEQFFNISPSLQRLLMENGAEQNLESE